MRFLYSVVLLLVMGCKETPVHIEIPYGGDKLVLWGKLKAGAPLRIQVTRSFYPFGAIPQDVTVSGAKVEVVVDGKEYIELSPSVLEKGIYLSDHQVRPGASYVVKASIPSLPAAKSDPVTVPLAPPDVVVKRIRDVPGEINHQTPQDLVSLYFTEQQVPESYYALSFVSYFEGDTISASPYGAMDNIVAKESDCHTWGRGVRIGSTYHEVLQRTFIHFIRAFLMKNKCLSDPGLPLNFYIETSKSDPERNLEQAYKVTLGIENVTKEVFDYSKIEYDQPEGIDLLVLPPQRALTNVENGYGLIFASNEKVIEIP